MTEGRLRTDLLLLDSGSTARSVSDRLGDREDDPVVLVRRRCLRTATWHHLTLEWLRRAIAIADPEAYLAELVDLDSLNEVPVLGVEASEHGKSGVVVDDGDVIGFWESYPSPPTGRVRRGLRSIPKEPQAAPPSMAEPEPLRAAREEEAAGPWTAGADVRAPGVVRSMEPFTVTVGVMAAAEAVPGELIEVADLPEEVTEIALDVQCVSPFTIVDGSGGYGSIVVERATLRHQPVEFRLRAEQPPPTYDPSVGIWVDRVLVLYSHQGAPVGQAWREVRVEMTGRPESLAAAEAVPQAGGATPLSLAAEAPPVDLTVSIVRSTESPATGSYVLAMTSPHLADPSAPEIINVGTDAQSFGGRLIPEVDRHVNDPLSNEVIEGLGQELADLLHATSFSETLDRVWQAVSGPQIPEERRRPPDVLLLTDESQIPWELTWLADPPDPRAPPYLGAQVNLGRWLTKPDPPPREEKLAATGMAIVVGHYAPTSGVAPLPKALEEAKELSKLLRGRTVTASTGNLDFVFGGQLLQPPPPFDIDVLHFAGHGQRLAESGYAYLMLDDGSEMSPFVFRSAPVARQRAAFLFLNACQVGTASEMLGRYAGIAGFSIRAGFRGLIAPLWSVQDNTAKEVALEFYASQTAGEPVASFLRRIRSRFEQTAEAYADTTWLAYVFYGHPRLTLGNLAKPQP